MTARVHLAQGGLGHGPHALLLGAEGGLGVLEPELGHLLARGRQLPALEEGEGVEQAGEEAVLDLAGGLSR